MFVVHVLATLALQYIAPTIEIKQYTSPSHGWCLVVVPSNRSGAGGSHVTAARNGINTWEKDLPFTPWGALVDDDGRVGGYAYTTGYAGTDSPGELILFELSERGDVLADEHIARRSRNIDDMPADPLAVGVFEHTQRSIFVVRVSSDSRPGCEQWWEFDKWSGRHVETVTPASGLDASDLLRGSFAAYEVAGTQLTLVHWFHFKIDCSYDEVGARFVLYDPHWKPVWSLELPLDYMVDDSDAYLRLLNEMQTRGAILSTCEPRHFELRYVADNARVTFEVSPDADRPLGWSVREVARYPYVEHR